MNDEKIYPYFGISDVEEMYITLKGSRTGITNFLEKAKMIASRSSKGKSRGAFIFKDEEALFKLFKSELPNEIKARKIRYFGELVQMIS